MANRSDINLLIGKKYNLLTILSESNPHKTIGGNIHRTVLCMCDCGKEKVIQVSPVISGFVKSCGCFSAKMSGERASIRNKTHGLTKTSEYNTWSAIKKRCGKPSHKSYKHYGGRGISICDRWKTFENFYEDMGTKPFPSASVDRIDNNGNYEPGNCRWATKKEQTRNQRNNVIIEYKGVKKCLGEWAEVYGLLWQTIYHRIFISKQPSEKWFIPKKAKNL